MSSNSVVDIVFLQCLNTICSARNEGSIRVFTATRTIIRTFDTSRTFTFALPNIAPEKRPAILGGGHCGARLAIVGFAGAVWCAIDLVILMVRLEHRKCLLAGARVVGAFCSLDCL